MKKYLILILLVCSFSMVKGQGAYNIKPGTYSVVSSAGQMVLKKVNFVNNGAYIDSTGTFTTIGNNVLSGSGSTFLNNYNINSRGKTQVNSAVSVNNTANLTFDTLASHNNLIIRSDLNNAAYMVVTGKLYDSVPGIIASRAAISGSCPTYTSVLSVNISGPAMKYQWRQSSDSATWTNITGATNRTYTASVTSSSVFYLCHITTNNTTYTGNTPGMRLNLSMGTTLAGVISGPTSVCEGDGIFLTRSLAGGTWSSSDPAVATVTATGGSSAAVVGIMPGIAVISYSVTNACGTVSTTRTITVNAMPNAGMLFGLTNLCPGWADYYYASGTPGGAWSSSDPSVVSVSMGFVTGISAGSAVVSYSVTNGCGTAVATNTIVVNPMPVAGTISGPSVVYVGSLITLTDPAPYGTWNSDDASIASISGLGIVSGVSPGSTIITYSVSNYCGFAYTTYPVTVHNRPGSGGGSGTGTGGAGAGAYLVIDPGGHMVGSANDHVVLNGVNFKNNGTYTDSTGDVTTFGGITFAGGGTTWMNNLNINSQGKTIMSNLVSVGNLTNLITDTLNANNKLFIRSDINEGANMVDYSELTGLVQGLIVHVANSGVPCDSTYLSLNLSGPPVNYQWQYSPNSIFWTNISGATDPTYIPTVSGTKYYRCHYTTTNTTFNEFTPGVLLNIQLSIQGTITGAQSLCTGTSTTLSDTLAGGIWSSSDPSIASIDIAGNMAGVSAGTAIISYYWSIGCTATDTITIVTTPTPITGSASACTGSTATLGDGTAGGTWSSSNTSTATIDSISGVATGVAEGTTTITYFVSSSCYTTQTFTVTTIPAIGPISGTSTLCAAATSLMTDPTPGGYWFSSDTTIASINSSGLVTGVAPGSAIINYSVINSCGINESFRTVTVNPSPAPITGTSTICQGSSTTLSDTTSGGVWSSSLATVATIGSLTGDVDGILAGTAIITYTGASGCFVTDLLTVNPSPSAGTITGTSMICTGTSSTMTDLAVGGVWSSTSPAVGSVSPAGVVSGLTAGTTIISYTVTNSCGSAAATILVTVNPSPDAGTIAGTTTICAASTTTLIDGAPGGVWSSSNTAVATVGTTGNVTGIGAGTALISYTVSSSCGSAITSIIITVNPLPVTGFITGLASVCPGASTLFSASATGGVWSSSNTAVGTVAASGIVTGISAGTSIISYAVTNGCGTAYATKPFTVNGLPDAGTISGPSAVCVLASISLSSTTTGGIWSVSNGNVTVTTFGGVVTGVSAGTSIISYSYTNSCGSAVSTHVVTINPNPVAGTLTGPSTVGVGASITITASVGGGAWTATNTNATVLFGVVTGASVGFDTIVYAVSNSCGSAIVTKTVFIGSVPPITGPTSICPGSIVTLSDGLAGGTWSSSNTSVATIGSIAGTVTGVSTGTTIISYIVSGLYTTALLTVNTMAGITGPTSVCRGQNITLTDASPGGTWSSATPSIATVGSTNGVVTGVASGAGAATIVYTLGVGCSVTYNVTVNALSPISGASSLCQGQTTTLTNPVTGGVWSSGDATITIGSVSGVVTGISAGTATVSYLLATGCTATSAIVIYTSSPITGPTTVCQGQTITLSNATGGGTWSSASPSIATVGSASGIVTGVAGYLSATILYTLGSGCVSNYTITVNALAAISGAPTICIGQTSTYTNPVPGGLWSSSGPAITIGSASGSATGISTGSAVISYTTLAGCITSNTVSVNTVSPITGPGTVCQGQTITLANGTPRGNWSSVSPTIATIGSSSGILTGVAGGYSATINYTLASGCIASTVVTVNPLSPISGLVNVCPALTITLTDAVPGGTWQSSSISLATVGSVTGVVTGVTAGTVVISYILPTGCVTTKNIAVGAMAPITGPTRVCLGQTITLSDVVPGGSWNSGSPSIATVGSSSGIVTGLAANLTANITYSISASCRAITTVSVAALTATSISSTVPICVGTTNTATNPTAGGTWSTNNTSIALIGTTGVITGVSAGTVVISYTLPSGCIALTTTTVNPLSPITGPSSVCLGQTITLSDATGGGTWASGGSSATIASINLSTGVVTGLAANLMATLTYTLGTGCKANFTVSVLPIPAAPASISGASTVSISGAPITLTDATGGGTWSSSNALRATVVAGTGVVTGVGLGTATITYTVTNASGCTNYVTKNITVGPTPPHSGDGSSLNTTIGNEMLNGNIALMPNPNKGDFILKGNLSSVNDEELVIEVSDLLGQIVFRGKAIAYQGAVNERIQLNSNLANGMYLLTLFSSTETRVFHFVVEQ